MESFQNSAGICDDEGSVRILHLEDSAADAELVRNILEGEKLPFSITLTKDRASFQKALSKQKFGLILCDHGIPGYDGFAALRLARELQPETPVIMFSGSLDDAQAVESLKCGAVDYLLKQKLARLAPAIRRALHEAAERAEKKKLEATFLRAQRMDSIGALAGGIAHDLNNALAPILMSVELIKETPDEATLQRFLDIIASSAQRATGMVKQILGFARGYSGSGPVMAGHLVREIGKMVQETFPKSISIYAKTGGQELWAINGDATELHQVLLNLCVNARDAMPAGGKLTLSAQNVELDEEMAAPLKAAPGAYVMLSVADTGSGIPPEVLPRIFEPFFTTKLPDKGTGLGLSTVAGIVKNRGGCIDINTEQGKGTEFRVYIPALEMPAQAANAAPRQELPAGHGELILVIEDEETICELTKTTLENYGYRVITAQNGVQGISRFEERRDEVRALITDTDLPYLNGLAAVSAIKALRPDLPVIVTSGSKQDTEQRVRMDVGHLTNLAKPFSAEQLLIAVGAVIQSDGSKPRAARETSPPVNWLASPADSSPCSPIPNGCLGA